MLYKIHCEIYEVYEARYFLNILTVVAKYNNVSWVQMFCRSIYPAATSWSNDVETTLYKHYIHRSNVA